jgi:hypothetical protein
MHCIREHSGLVEFSNYKTITKNLTLKHIEKAQTEEKVHMGLFTKFHI